ncbi:MAG: MATE family efflux transporter, partial [Treponema sp.]|nr:MATE family efflux transporter [Treponema sp.]
MKITELFSNRQFYKNLFVIALPIMLQSFFSSAVNMVDTIMLGRLGTVEIAGVGLANQIFFLYNMVLFGLCSGTSIFTAQFWGKRDLAGIRHNMGFSLIISLGAAALFVAFAFFAPETLIGIYSRDPLVIAAGAEYLHIACLSYIPLGISTVIVFTLRSVEKVRLPMVTTIIALSFNSLSNYFLIFGNGPFPALGVKGAAVTTIIARTIELVLLISFSNIKKYPIICRLSELLGFHLPYVRRFFRIVLPVLANEMIWSFGVSMQNLIFARTHTDAYAAFNITGTVNMLTWVIFLGLGNGVAVLIGKKIGEGNETAARDYATRISLFAPLLAVGIAFVLMGISL